MRQIFLPNNSLKNILINFIIAIVLTAISLFILALIGNTITNPEIWDELR